MHTNLPAASMSETGDAAQHAPAMAALRRLLRPSISKKFIAFVGIVFLVMLANVLVVRTTLERQEGVAATLDSVGTLRWLTQRTQVEMQRLALGLGGSAEEVVAMLDRVDRELGSITAHRPDDVAKDVGGGHPAGIAVLRYLWTDFRIDVDETLVRFGRSEDIRADLSHLFHDANAILAAAEEASAGLARRAESARQEALGALYALALVDLAVGIVGFVLIRAQVLRPLQRLAQASRRFAAGEFGERVRFRSGDEIGELAEAFDGMAEQTERHIRRIESDMAEIRHQEDRIRRLNGELELRVRERTRRLEATNRELEAFSYSVSHDLRAPLRSINGFSAVLEEKCADAEAQDCLRRIRGASVRMGELIDDLLRLSRLSRAELAPQSVDLSELARQVLADLAGGNPDRRVDMHIADGLRVHGDPRLLRIVLENLLGNAWKFTAKREVAHIALGSRKENGCSVIFVRDNGAGFDPRYAGKLFAAFQRLHPAEEFEGSGIGLAIVQRIVNLHGGRIWAEGEPGRGATFSFVLPAAPMTHRSQLACVEAA